MATSLLHKLLQTWPAKLRMSLCVWVQVGHVRCCISQGHCCFDHFLEGLTRRTRGTRGTHQSFQAFTAMMQSCDVNWLHPPNGLVAVLVTLGTFQQIVHHPRMEHWVPPGWEHGEVEAHSAGRIPGQQSLHTWPTTRSTSIMDGCPSNNFHPRGLRANTDYTRVHVGGVHVRDQTWVLAVHDLKMVQSGTTRHKNETGNSWELYMNVISQLGCYGVFSKSVTLEALEIETGTEEILPAGQSGHHSIPRVGTSCDALKINLKRCWNFNR